jgi:hypothetical protein
MNKILVLNSGKYSHFLLLTLLNVMSCQKHTKCTIFYSFHSLVLWSPSPSKARSLPSCCVAHAWVQLVPIYLHMYCNVDGLNSGLGCRENFTEQPSIWCCHLGTFCCTISGGGGGPSTISCLQSRGLQFVQCVVLRIRLGKEKEKWLCGTTLHAKVLQTVPHNCKYRKCVFCRFFSCKFSRFFNKFFICFYKNNLFIFIFKLKYDTLSIRIW